ncbi:MAG: cellulose synthase subunit BcsC-related outer membrane protein [Halothiobacillaceae bacterium]|nr:cellulose synthase subunit BcsC-related outer membrane protein [Halothiobacillaceae bacterium]
MASVRAVCKPGFTQKTQAIMQLKPLLMLAPLCSGAAFAAPEVRPLASSVEQKSLPSASTAEPRSSALTRTQAIQAPAQHRVLPSALRTPKPVIAPAPKTDDRSISELAPPTTAPRAKPPRKPSTPSTAATRQTRAEEARATQAIKLYEAKDFSAALSLLKQSRPFYIRTQDAGMVSLVGFAALEAGENQLALDSFRQAAEWTDDEEFWLVLVDAHLRLEQPEEAQKILDGLPKSKERDQRIDALLGARASKAFESGQYTLAEKMLLEAKAPLGAANLELLGWIQLRLGKLNESAASFEASYRKKPSSGAAQGLAFSHQRLKSIDTLVALADALKGPLLELTSDPAVREQVAAGQWTRIAVNEKGQLILGAASAHTPSAPGLTVRVGPTYRQRNGDEGQGKLDVAGASAVAEWVGAQDRVSVRVDQFQADNGETRQSSMNTLYALWRHQTQDALELSLGLGVSPTGGELSTKPIGELGVARYDAEYGWNAKLFRQANMESILSMSGARQVDAAGQSLRWGQVLEDGVNLGGYITLPGALKDWKAEGSLTAARITGEGVADNRKIAFWGRALRPIDDWAGWRAGVDMYSSAFDKNMSYYTPGFGGYYSPQASLNLGGVLAYEGQIHALKLNAQAGAGWGYVKQSAADGNPLTGAEPGKYASSSSSGLATHLDLDARLPLGDNWSVGLNLGSLNSPGYEEWKAWLFVDGTF